MNKEYLIAQWLKGEATNEELLKLQELPEFEDYSKILDHAHYFKAPEFDSQKAYSSFLNRKNSKKNTNWYWIAASLLLFLSVGSLFFMNNDSKTTYSTSVAQQKEIILPDNSKVILNASSKISFDKNNWESNRTINLSGEAYFKVSKGEKFDVLTDRGKVSVLGTEFKVKDRENVYEVETFEGLVQVTTLDTVVKVPFGNNIIQRNGKLTAGIHRKNSPSWSNGKSTFVSTPLYEVLNELERQYDIKLNRSINDQNLLFTGSFSHNNLNQALQSISIPMKLNYSINDEKYVSLESIEL